MKLPPKRPPLDTTKLLFWSFMKAAEGSPIQTLVWEHGERDS
jgi:hypothetical protein